jgi:hypothetical protein
MRNHWKMKCYDQERALGPALILEKLSSAGESSADGLKTDTDVALILLHM